MNIKNKYFVLTRFFTLTLFAISCGKSEDQGQANTVAPAPAAPVYSYPPVTYPTYPGYPTPVPGSFPVMAAGNYEILRADDYKSLSNGLWKPIVPNYQRYPVQPGDKIELLGSLQTGESGGSFLFPDCNGKTYSSGITVMDGGGSYQLRSVLGGGPNTITVATPGYVTLSFVGASGDCAVYSNVRIILHHCLDGSGNTISCP